jgi:hypothetical protein
MEDYMYYLDLNAQKVAKLAIELGDYKCALENLLNAKERLNKYKGDSMIPIMMAGDLLKTTQEIAKKVENGKMILYKSPWILTKSSFVKGSQCPKYLYLEIFSRNEKTPPSKELLEIFKRGFLFEENVRNALYPSGINVKETLGDFSYFESYTAYLLNQPVQSIIYEATLIEERVFVMCDILIKNEDGFVDIYEIKSSTSVNDAIISDLSIQYAISKKRFQSKLRSFNLVLRKDAEDFDFEIVNLTEELDKKFDTVTEKISAFIKLLRDGEPDIKMGQQCQKPYLCEFVEYCSRKV